MLIGYARVSTEEQNLDLQIDALRSVGCKRIFADKLSGSRSDRPGLADAVSHLRPGDTLAVWKLDRLGRTVRQLVEFVSTLNHDGIEFRSLTDGIDTKTPTGRFFFHMMAALAEMERDLTRERTMAGLMAARARGRKGGRPRALTKKQVTQVKHLMTHPDQSMAEIAATMGVSRSTLYRAIRTSQK